MNKNMDTEALTNKELEQTAGGATVYTENGFYVTADPVAPTYQPQPTPVIPAPAPVLPSYNPTGSTTYIVQSGDTLGKIAKMYGTTVSNLMALNPQIWDANKISVGQVIRIA